MELKMQGNTICLMDSRKEELVQLFKCGDLYQNLSGKPMISEGDNRISITNKLIHKLETLPDDLGDLPGGKIGYQLLVAMLFHACVGQKHLHNVLLDGLGTLQETVEDVLGFFGVSHPLTLLKNGQSLDIQDKKVSVAILDGQYYKHGQEQRFEEILRLMSSYGFIIVISAEEELEPLTKRFLNEARHESFCGIHIWLLPVTAEMLQSVGKCSVLNEDKKSLWELWEEIRKPLYDMTEAAIEETAGDMQQLLMCIAGLHTIEEAIICLDNQLDDMELKLLSNWAKMAAMDFYLEINMERPDVLFFQEDFKRRVDELDASLEKEFGYLDMVKNCR